MKGGVVVECLNRFNAKMARTGSSIRGDKIKASKMILDETFYDDASFQSGVYFWRLGLLERDDYENEDEIGIRIYKRTFSNDLLILLFRSEMLFIALINRSIFYAQSLLMLTEYTIKGS